MTDCALDVHRVMPRLLTADEMTVCTEQAAEDVAARQAAEAAQQQEADAAMRAALKGRHEVAERARALDYGEVVQPRMDADFVAKLDAMRAGRRERESAVPAHLAHLRSGMPGGDAA